MPMPLTISSPSRSVYLRKARSRMHPPANSFITGCRGSTSITWNPSRRF